MNVLGCLLAFAAMALAYLSSRNQRVLALPLRRGGKLLAWVFAAGALACWVTGETTLPGIFSTLTALMLGAVAFPYVTWLLKPAAERKAR
ncbi:hypothetical protein [Luteibacter sp.]|uniref:hypothetical protein n=1 Tax=Luteibacter sp. TaxID=1886636 RepID=UPI003F7D3F17